QQALTQNPFPARAGTAVPPSSRQVARSCSWPSRPPCALGCEPVNDPSSYRISSRVQPKVGGQMPLSHDDEAPEMVHPVHAEPGEIDTRRYRVATFILAAPFQGMARGRDLRAPPAQRHAPAAATDDAPLD